MEWLGEVPEHWEVKKLKYLLSEPLMYGANESAESNDRNFPRYIRITDMNDDGTLKDNTFRSLPMNIAKFYLLKNEDILLARSGATVGKSFYFQDIFGESCFAGYLIRARVNKNISLPRFVYLYFQSKIYWGFIFNNTIQATIQNVSAEKYNNFSITLPPLSEQQMIIEYLDEQTTKIDHAINIKLAQIEKLKEYKTVLINEVVTGKRRVVQN